MRIVSIGGGTGLSTLLSGLKTYTGSDEEADRGGDAAWIETLTAVVTVTDDGGSSGRLREEFQILPPGDIRNCIVALAEDEHLLTRLFQHRFESEGDLAGHSFGNLFLAALASVTGDFLEAIKVSGEVLAIKGRIFPSTVQDVALVAELEDGRVVRGETNIVQARSRIKRLRLSSDHCRPLPETLEAIAHADIVTIGPGSLYTSIVPNLLVDGIVDAMRNSSALKIYICNIMTQPGETDGFSVEDHVKVLFDYSPDLELDYVVVNNALIGESLREKYLADGAAQVEPGSFVPAEISENERHHALPHISDRLHRFRIVCSDVLHEDGLVRHDPDKIARLLLKLHQSGADACNDQSGLSNTTDAELVV
ncbi:MAG TPA: gluconeogenesis factor YvcK family protein [Blastocatellia bacterium]|nr:gluconeogenesis factor YvcK family protein [Blastocatellia bacterium]